ncbi:hypothetical protein Moror_13807 [Moniliophthora roreri MCA 2997]|uniref:Alpha/beta-hydrolase n=2 Tax=Moniliophthora roreri TaxID=221103 RepID=V2XN64_MONRO|nr:hypothetical protein Moror_13807 [Moniliophthora roreri MCA 2997]
MELDIYPPTLSTQPFRSAVVYFHGGGLTVGTRESWFPVWLLNRLREAGHTFICPEYRLIPSGGVTGHEILEDVKDVFAFLLGAGLQKALENIQLDPDSEPRLTFQFDPSRIAVAGTSAGSTCAYLAAVHVQPRPKAVVSLYGMGGDFLTPHYYNPKTKPFLRGREILDPTEFSEFLYPFSSTDTSPVPGSPLEYHPPTYRIPGYPANPRMLLSRLYLQLGTFLDYYTGQHEPSLSASLRKAQGKTSLAKCISDRDAAIFPSLSLDANWPPALFVHGSEDTAVPVHESKHMHSLLQEVGASSELIIVEGKEHSFDYEADSEVTHKDLFDHVAQFLDKHLF